MMAAVLGWEGIVTRGLESGDVYVEIEGIIATLRDENSRLGGDDRAFGVMICAQLGLISLPCLREAPQGSVSRKRRGRAPVVPFLTEEDRKDLNAHLRLVRIERAKKALEVCKLVELHRLLGDGDLSLDGLAERLCDLFFGEQADGSH